jgi:CDP-glucose 4,6-dehydratase
MHFFITGHTGFKGSWMTLLLKELGHEVSGLSLKPDKDGLFVRANIQGELKNHFLGDIRKKNLVAEAIGQTSPDFAIHMAAQPLVMRGYEDPSETFTTNVDGTRNFLDAVTTCSQPPITLVVTTDKVYRDEKNGCAYTENHPLGGRDPYSASKSMSDILAQSYAHLFPSQKIFIARAGNVIGSFDISEKRLIPDIVRAKRSGRELEIRNPLAVRPWQHVLDCLAGYLAFVMVAKNRNDLPIALNFGPDPNSFRTVEDVLSTARSVLKELNYRVTHKKDAPRESEFLTLDSSAAELSLGWKNKIEFERAVEWSLAEIADQEPRVIVKHQIVQFLGSK